MPSDFEAHCRSAREAIAVPAFPAYAIRAAVSKSPRGLRRIAVVTAFAAASMVAIAAAAMVGGGMLRVTKNGGLVLSAQHGSVHLHARESDVGAAVRSADFPVTLPAGMPAGTRLKSLVTAGTSVIVLQYDLPGAWRRSNHLLTIFLANPQAMSGALPRGKYQSVRMSRRPEYLTSQWRAHGEEVVLVAPRAGIRPSEISAIRSAMTR